MLRETLALTGLLAADLLHTAACALADRIGGRGGAMFHVHVAPWRIEPGGDGRTYNLFLADLPYPGDEPTEPRSVWSHEPRRYGRLAIVTNVSFEGDGETYLLDSREEQTP